MSKLEIRDCQIGPKVNWRSYQRASFAFNLTTVTLFYLLFLLLIGCVQHTVLTDSCNSKSSNLVKKRQYSILLRSECLVAIFPYNICSLFIRDVFHVNSCEVCTRIYLDSQELCNSGS